VKTFWTRDDDIRHDFYHPFTLVHASAPRDLSVRPRTSSVSGWGPPTGAWRSVAEMNEGFAIGSILDEMATAAGIDVVEVYRRLYADELLPVVELAAERAGWGSTLPDGWGRGLAAYATFGATPVAIVIEASIDGGHVRVQRVVCAIDCGIAVDPGGVIAQMEGGIVFALSAALHEEITLREGRIQQSSYVDFPILRMNEMPTLEVHVLPSRRDPSGAGEMGVPPTSPALMNAVFAATGRRIRHLPIRPEDLADLPAR
jgi:isoquinoline 1-oxidoreductase subunit beta